MEQIEIVTETIKAILEDETLPKQIVATLNRILEILNGPDETGLKKDKCIHQLEDVDANSNIEAGIRVQLLDVASAIEQL